MGRKKYFTYLSRAETDKNEPLFEQNLRHPILKINMRTKMETGRHLRKIIEKWTNDITNRYIREGKCKRERQ